MKCPHCGAEGTLTYEEAYQYRIVYRITKSGKVSKRGKKEDCGSEDWQMVYCSNCHRAWSNYYHGIDEDGSLELVGEGTGVDDF